MDIDAVTRSYRRWAPIYDGTFGRITRPGRLRATEHVNTLGGDVLEVGVGTGLALRHYGPDVTVTGIDFSAEMLAQAKEKAANLDRIDRLQQMDARHLDFPDNSFDAVVAMYLISVVPEPERVLAEMARVCRPGGEIVIVNHFAADGGPLGHVEQMFSPFANRLGWHSDFRIETVLSSGHAAEIARDRIAPFGMFTFLRLRPLKHACAA